MRRALSWLGSGALIGFLALLLLEGLVRLFLPQELPHDLPELWEPNEELGWSHSLGVRLLANTGERGVWICTDALGDRVDCERLRQAQCMRRFLVIGDSYVEALAIPYRQTVWSLLEEDTGACAFVAGVGGYGVAQYLTLARQRLAPGEPRYELVVLVLYVGNDFTSGAEHVPPREEVQRKPLRLLPERISAKAMRDWFYPYNAWLRSHSQAYVAIRFAMRRFRDPAGVAIYGVPGSVRPSVLTEKVLDETARSVRLIAGDVQRSGARLLVVVIPFRSQVLDPRGERLRAAFPRLAADVDMNLVRDRFTPRLRATSEIAAVVDLLPLLRAHATSELWGTRDGHFTPEGHRLWFEALRGPVRDLLGIARSAGE